MTRVVVRPAGSGRESLFVAILCAAIVAAAGTVAALRARPADEPVRPAWRVDARDRRNAAAQGLNPHHPAAIAGGEAPSPEQLADEALPPFARDVTSAKRGAHSWRLVRDGGKLGYLGATGDAASARSLLLRLGARSDAHGHGAETTADVWVHPSANSASALGDDALIAAGWRQVTSRYDASVTREAR